MPPRPTTSLRALRDLHVHTAHPHPIPSIRRLSTASPKAPDHQDTTPNPIPSRWLPEAKSRIGKCLTFGLDRTQKQEASILLHTLATSWRELLAGPEGFLTAPNRRGVWRRGVEWGEMDSMGHVNNVMYNRYAETGRIEWVLNYARYLDPGNRGMWEGLMRPEGVGLILRGIKTEFKFVSKPPPNPRLAVRRQPLKYPDHITIYHRLATEPHEDMDAFHFHVVILSELHQRVAARVTEDTVVYDYRVGKKTRLPTEMVRVLRETWRLQEEARGREVGRVRGVLERVRALEVGSWDREGAVEDLGTAA